MDPLTMAIIGGAQTAASLGQAGRGQRQNAVMQAQNSLSQAINGIQGANTATPQITPLEMLWQQMQGGQGLRF